MNDLSSVISRVQKLLALANNNSNLNEAQSAASRADALIQEYRLSTAQLQNKETGPEMDCDNVYVGGKRSQWRESLLHGICNHYGCSWYLTSKRGDVEYNVVGQYADVEIVRNMFLWLEETLTVMSKRLNHGKGVAYGKAWLVGASHGVHNTFVELSKKASEDVSTAMVLLSNRKAQSSKYLTEVVLSGKGKDAKHLGKVSDVSAYAQGVMHGKSISINASSKLFNNL